MTFQKRFVSEPKKFPAAATFSRDGWNFDLHIADLVAWKAYFANIVNFDPAALKAAAAEGPVTVDAMKQALAEGAEWTEPRTFKPDGPEVPCLYTGKNFQPVEIPWSAGDAEGVGGNYRTAQAEEIEKLPADVQAQVNELTETILRENGHKGIPEGLKTRIIAVSQEFRVREFKSRDGNRPVSKASHYRTRAGIVDVLFARDSKINTAVAARQRRDAVVNAFTRGGQNRGGNSHHGGDYQRQPKEKVKLYGRLFEKETARLLALSFDSLDKIRATTTETLMKMGIAKHERAAEAILASANWEPRGNQREATAHMGDAFAMSGVNINDLTVVDPNEGGDQSRRGRKNPTARRRGDRKPK